jgi:hypothetical protein
MTSPSQMKQTKGVFKREAAKGVQAYGVGFNRLRKSIRQEKIVP